MIKITAKIVMAGSAPISKAEFMTETYSLPDSRGMPIDHVLISDYFNFRKNGFFVEVGANNGLDQSNTALLERRFGWKGLLIEASPKLIEECRVNRPNSIVEHCALVSFDYGFPTVRGDFRSGHLMSSVNGRRLNSNERDLIEVPAAPLASLLAKHNITNIDFMSLDTEGYEFEILKGIDFSRHSPKWLLVEIYDYDYDKIVELLRRHKYDLIANVSHYNLVDNPIWDGTMNDFLFRRANQ